MTVPAERGTDFSEYGLGDERALADYERHDGVRFRDRSVQCHTMDDWLRIFFCRRQYHTGSEWLHFHIDHFPLIEGAQYFFCWVQLQQGYFSF